MKNDPPPVRVRVTWRVPDTPTESRSRALASQTIARLGTRNIAHAVRLTYELGLFAPLRPWKSPALSFKCWT
ncbi:hypothetical protein GCM10010272_65490 [Streptomyces lateritius]|nr:hypothetical protein GCM10010272_65490 [Streptomyces lateritius]